jgi:hypothetical protein
VSGAAGPTPRYLNARQVAALCSAGVRAPGPRQVREWSRVGVVVPGYPQRIRLAYVQLPSGMAWDPLAVEQFLQDLRGAAAVVAGELSRPAAGAVLKLVGQNRPGQNRPGQSRPGGAGRAGRTERPGFRRCLPEEIGTYPAVGPTVGPLRNGVGAQGRGSRAVHKSAAV